MFVLRDASFYYGTKVCPISAYDMKSLPAVVEGTEDEKEIIEAAMDRHCGFPRDCRIQYGDAMPDFNIPATLAFVANGWQVVYIKENI